MIHRLYPIINIQAAGCTNTPSNHGASPGRRMIQKLRSCRAKAGGTQREPGDPTPTSGTPLGPGGREATATPRPRCSLLGDGGLFVPCLHPGARGGGDTTSRQNGRGLQAGGAPLPLSPCPPTTPMPPSPSRGAGGCETPLSSAWAPVAGGLPGEHRGVRQGVRRGVRRGVRGGVPLPSTERAGPRDRGHRGSFVERGKGAEQSRAKRGDLSFSFVREIARRSVPEPKAFSGSSGERGGEKGGAGNNGSPVNRVALNCELKL